MCNNSNEELYDLVFGQEKTLPNYDKDDDLFSIINDEADMPSATFTCNDTSISSLDEKYSNRVNIRIENID